MRLADAASAVTSFFAPRHTPGTVRVQLVSAAISTVTVVVCCLVFSPQIGVISLLGALVPFWETGRPLWARIRNGLLVSGGLTASMAVGVQIAPARWAVVPASVVMILVIGWIYYTFMLTRGPSPVMMIYAAVLGTFFGLNQSVGWSMVAVTAVASLLSSALLLLPLILSPRGPERRAVAEAARAVARFRKAGSSGEDGVRGARDAAGQAVAAAWLTLQSAWPADRGRRFAALVDELTAVDRDFAVGVGADLRDRVASPRAVPLLGRPTARYLVSHAWPFGSVEWFTTGRMAVAAGVAGVVSEMLGLGHPYWAILTAAIVVNQWIDRRAATRRGLQRAAGTLLGVGVALAVALLHPTPWMTVALVILCMIGQYIVFTLNYALALVLITPMALLAVEASGVGSSLAVLAGDRLADTVVGSAAAIAVTWAASGFMPRRLVRAQSRRSIAAADAVEQADAADGRGALTSRRRRVELQYELTHHMSILERAVADDPRLADVAPVEHAVADRGYAVLARFWGRTDRTPDPGTV